MSLYFKLQWIFTHMQFKKMHIFSNVTSFTISNVFNPIHTHNQSKLTLGSQKIHLFNSIFNFSLSFWLGSLLQSLTIWPPAERGGEKLILLLASYAVLGLSQSAPALALIWGDSLSNSSAQDLSVKRAAVGILVNSETPRSIGLTRARSQMTNYKDTLLHSFL